MGLLCVTPRRPGAGVSLRGLATWWPFPWEEERGANPQGLSCSPAHGFWTRRAPGAVGGRTGREGRVLSRGDRLDGWAQSTWEEPQPSQGDSWGRHSQS